MASVSCSFLMVNLRGSPGLFLEHTEKQRCVFWARRFVVKEHEMPLHGLLLMFLFLIVHGDREKCEEVERVAIGEVEAQGIHSVEI